MWLCVVVCLMLLFMLNSLYFDKGISMVSYFDRFDRVYISPLEWRKMPHFASSSVHKANYKHSPLLSLTNPFALQISLNLSL